MVRIALICTAITVGFGVFAVFLGQDANWDTRNYHVYNPYALLTGRLDLDLAPAQMQTYFSPFIDLPVFWLNQYVPPWVVGFLMGGFQGLNAVLVFLIARTVILVEGKPAKLSTILLALLGCLNASFVAQLGTSGGDSASATFVLFGLYLLCRRQAALRQDLNVPQLPAAEIGLLMGLAVGLKLTNAPFAVAMALTLALIPANTTKRVRHVLNYCAGALASFAVTSVWWLHKVWSQFGNPLFPQFNSIFHSDLATATSVIDTRWGPVNFLEAATWPFWMGLRPARIHDAPMYNYLWPLAYIALFLWFTRAAWLKWRHKTPIFTGGAAAWVLIFSGISYLVWMKVFSIGRYMIAVEVMLPLFLYLGIRAFSPHRLALTFTLILACWSLSIGIMHSNFGLRAAWATTSYEIDVPPIESPGTATLLVATAGEPNSWMLPQFPEALAVLRVSGNFPRSPAYDERVRKTISARAGKVYVLVQADQDLNVMRLAQINAELAAGGLAQRPAICEAINKVMANFSRYKPFQIDIDSIGSCRAHLRDRETKQEHSNIDYQALANHELTTVGYKLTIGTCSTHSAFIGQMDFAYQWCEATAITEER